MEITEVRVKLVQDNTERLKAFCSVTFDQEYVVRDLKIIEGANGLFVAMPSRKLTDRCPKCGAKNHLRARYCNECGTKLNENRAGRDPAGRTKLHADVAHPINAQCRERIQNAIVAAYNEEIERSKEPGYVPPNLDEDDYDSSDFGPSQSSRESGSETETTGQTDEPVSEYEQLIADLKRDRERAHRRERSGRSAESTEDEQGSPKPESSRQSEPPANDEGFSAGIL